MPFFQPMLSIHAMIHMIPSGRPLPHQRRRPGGSHATNVSVPALAHRTGDAASRRSFPKRGVSESGNRGNSPSLRLFVSTSLLLFASRYAKLGTVRQRGGPLLASDLARLQCPAASRLIIGHSQPILAKPLTLCVPPPQRATYPAYESNPTHPRPPRGRRRQPLRRSQAARLLRPRWRDDHGVFDL